MHRTFKRSNHALAELYELTEQTLAAGNVGDAARFAVHLALEELFVNMVKYRESEAGDIDVEVSVASGRTTAVMTEHGVPEFDVTKTPGVDTTAALADRVPGGLGLGLVHNLVDSLDYQYNDGESRVIFTKESGI